MRNMFRWSVSEGDLMGAFRIDGARECLNRAVLNNTPDSLVPTGDGQPPKRGRD
jgi:hypothetical protein